MRDKGVSIKIKAVILTESDVAYMQALDETARGVFQTLKVAYRGRRADFDTMYSGPRLVLVACPMEFHITKAAQLSPPQFQALVNVGIGASTVDLLIQRRLELFEQGRFREARQLTGELPYDDGEA